jgi:hypothetical protein
MTSTEERYARATRSSHLELKNEAPGDVDTIIAAGLAETMGILLTRLRSEWDSVSKREIAHAGNSLTARVLILMNLRSLEPAKQSLFLFSVKQAPHKACSSDEAALAKLVGQVIDVWLDRLCDPCEGRGFSGGYGKARVMCAKCGGTGSRRNAKLGANAAEQAFGLWLLNVMDSRCNASLKQVQRKTRT